MNTRRYIIKRSVFTKSEKIGFSRNSYSIKALLCLVFLCVALCALLSGCSADSSKDIEKTSNMETPAQVEDTQTTVANPAETSTMSASEIRDQLQQAIRDFCELMFGSMKFGSTTTFGWNDFDSIEGYMIAKNAETKRETTHIDGTDITDVRIQSVELQGEFAEMGNRYMQNAIVSYEYVIDGERAVCGTHYLFTLKKEEQGYRVSDLTTCNPNYTMTDLDDNDIAILRDSLESWKEECKDAGDKWQFAAIDRIMEQKKVPIEDLIPEELIEEMKRRNRPTSKDANVLDIRLMYGYEPGPAMNTGRVFLEDEEYTYWMSATYLECYDVIFDDDSLKSVEFALDAGLIGLKDLDRFQIPYKKNPIGSRAGKDEPATEESKIADTTGSLIISEAETHEIDQDDEAGCRVKLVESDKWTQEELRQAVDTAKEDFRKMREGCKLLEIRYPGDAEAKNYSGFSSWNAEDTILLLGTWTDEAGNSYVDWAWFVCKNEVRGWYVKDQGL